MAHFPVAVLSDWFQRSLAHLESFGTEEGTYRFPAGYLRERPNGYWVTGAYTRLEENRRRWISLTLDSTFRMCKIKWLVANNTATSRTPQSQEERKHLREPDRH
jgi:hypothetical protein